jgi:hypothetical protein
MEQNNSDEIDLGIVFNKIKKVTNNFLISIYHGIQFLFKHWWKILIVALIGGVIGYILEKKDEPNKLTTLIVQTNFNSTDYVYEAVEQLNQKVKEKDTLFLKNIGLRTDTISIKAIKIEPIVNIVELLNKSKDTYRSLETLIEQINFSSDEDLFKSELFRTEYRYHNIFISTTSKGTQKDIDNVINYLNSNELFNEIKNIVIEETKNRIKHGKVTIEKIDNILDTQTNANLEKENASNLLVSNGTDYTDFYELINSKNGIIAQNISLETELTKYRDVVNVLNKPTLVEINEILNNKKLILATLFVFLYLLFFFMKKAFNTLKTISENAENNK